MSTQGKLPESGYFIDKVYANRLALTVQQPQSADADDTSVLFRWDWRNISEATFEVSIGLLLEPTPDRTEQVEVSIIGLFRKGTGKTEVPLGDFVRYHAPAILMPYVRESISSLTGRGFYPARLLPALNVQHLMDGQDPAKATGAQQLTAAGAVDALLLKPAEETSTRRRVGSGAKKHQSTRR